MNELVERIISEAKPYTLSLFRAIADKDAAQLVAREVKGTVKHDWAEPKKFMVATDSLGDIEEDWVRDVVEEYNKGIKDKSRIDIAVENIESLMTRAQGEGIAIVNKIGPALVKNLKKRGAVAEEIVTEKRCPKCGREMTIGSSHVGSPLGQWECWHCGYIEQVSEATQREMERHFVDRTKRHIGLVQKAIEKIVKAYPEFEALTDRGKVHDASKLREPERTPYVSITWRHKLENESGKFNPIKDEGYKTPGLLAKKEENEATLHHILNNSHHPEYHLADKSEANINAQDRHKSDRCVDATRMPDLDIAEMIADWQAMSEELKKNTARAWYEKQKNVRWKFSNKQEMLIDKLLKVFEDAEKETEA